MIPEDRLPEAVKKVNELHAWVNDNIEAIYNIVQAATYIEHDTKLSKADHTALHPILVSSPFRAFIRISSCRNTWLEADIHYPVSDHSCDYVAVQLYLGPDKQEFSKLETFTVESVKELNEEYQALRAKISMLESQANVLSLRIGQFTI